MIIVDCKQHSEDWHQVRLGIPTASRFDQLVSAKGEVRTGKMPRTYAHQLIAERLMGVPLESASSGYMQRGSEMEKQAVGYYELDRGVETTEVGFVLADDRLVGCSPDRLVGDVGGLEIVCPSPAKHIEYLASGIIAEKAMQVQGGMWITQREWWDVLSFHPDMPPLIVRVKRDIDTVVAISEAVDALYATMREAMLVIREQHGVEEHVWYPPSEFQAPLLLGEREEPATAGEALRKVYSLGDDANAVDIRDALLRMHNIAGGEATAPGSVPAWEAYR